MCTILVGNEELLPEDTIGVDAKSLIWIFDFIDNDKKIDFSSKAGIYIFDRAGVSAGINYILIIVNDTYTVFVSTDAFGMISHLYEVKEENPYILHADIMDIWIKKIIDKYNQHRRLAIGSKYGKFVFVKKIR